MQQLASAALNNEGVFFFERGELSISLAKFRSALEATIGSLDPNTTQTRGPSGISPSQSVSVPQCPIGFMDVPTPAPLFYCEDVMSGLQTYKRPINLVAGEGAYSPDPLVNSTVVSSIILFNLALVYHLKGLEGSDDLCQSRLQSAQSLYSKARTLLDEAGFSAVHSSGHPVVDILTMAIMNNQGQISFYLYDHEQAQKFFDLLVIYCSTVRPHDLQSNDGALLEWHMSAFLVNAITLQQPTHASAA